VSTIEISIIVVCHDMSRQMRNTLFTLSPEYQRAGNEIPYEVIIVENASDNNLPADLIESLPANFKYFRREETSVSPVAAINFGLEQATGPWLGLMVDGAHMLSPGVLHFASKTRCMSEYSLVTVPVYHLGPQEQHESAADGYDEGRESELLDSIDWRHNGYALFDIASWCGANPRGFLAPIIESNCFFAPASAFNDIGGADSRFQLPGGGAINLHMLRKLGTLPGLEYFCLGGEGTFHQYHGGVTSNVSRSQLQAKFDAQLQEFWRGGYRHLERNPVIVGSFAPETIDRLRYSSQCMERRFANCRKQGWQVWPDDAGLTQDNQS